MRKVRYFLYVRPRKGRKKKWWPRGLHGYFWAGVTTKGQGWAHTKGDKMLVEEVQAAKRIFRDCYGVGFEFKLEKVT